MKYKTTIDFEIQGKYGFGWECLTTEETLKDAYVQLKLYQENEPGVPYRIRKIINKVWEI